MDIINYKNMIKSSAYICIVLGLVLLTPIGNGKKLNYEKLHHEKWYQVTPIANGKKLHYERWYQERWCAANGGQTEVVFPDRTRCDCVTGSHAIEFDFGKKWAESIGQALYYSIQTGKRAGVVLILEKNSDYKYWIRLNTIIEHFSLPIDTWITAPRAVLIDKGQNRCHSEKPEAIRMRKRGNACHD